MQLVHHVPGRLRIRLPELKGRPAEAAKFAARVEAVRGVRSVAANAVTGSAIILYDARVVRADDLLGVLSANARASDLARVPRGSGFPSVARRIGQGVAKTVVQTLLERSAMALISAVV